MTQNRIVEGLRALPDGDRTLLKAFVVMAVLSLGLGLVYGTVTAFARAGFVELIPETGYRMMTLHGVTIFFYWLTFVQAGLVLVLSACYTDGVERLAWRGAAWTGFALMTGGFVLNQYAPVAGAVLLYDAQPGLAGDERTAAGVFYLGYLLLAVGAFLVAAASVATALRPRIDGKIDSWSSISFASVSWAGLLMVSSLAAINAFLPAGWWAFGFGEMPVDYTMSWHVLFHNLHYLPLMATVLIWYVLVETITGVKSIFGQRFSKIVFASYLVLVPPTSLYHMFLEPGLSDGVKAAGSLLSLFIGVPTSLVFLVIVISLEVHARAHGARGLFGWVRQLPWANPAMSAIGMATVNAALGGALSFVLIQSRLAPLLSDTFFVPGYFHFLTLGTVTLTFIAALIYVIPGVTGRQLRHVKMLAVLPYVMTAGLVIFGVAGIVAGYRGVPRRVFDVVEGGLPADWAGFMVIVGIGAVIMAVALAAYVYAFAATLLAGAREPRTETGNLAALSWGGVAIGRQTAWVGPLCIVVMVGAMYAFTVLGFEIMKALPLVVTGGAAH